MVPRLAGLAYLLSKNNGVEFNIVKARGGKGVMNTSDMDVGWGASVALSLRSVRTKTHKMTLDAISSECEIYDLVNDPDELTNLFHDRSSAAIRAALSEMLAQRPDDMRADQVQVGIV